MRRRGSCFSSPLPTPYCPLPSSRKDPLRPYGTPPPEARGRRQKINLFLISSGCHAGAVPGSCMSYSHSKKKRHAGDFVTYIPPRDLYNKAMYCLGCEYELVGLVENRCPECGRGFDASDPTTFASSRPMGRRDRRAARLEIGLIMVAMVPLIANVFAYTALIGARISLGQWPQRDGFGPSSIPGIGFFTLGAMLFAFASIPSVVAGLMLAIALLTHKAWTQLLRSGLLATILLACGFALSMWDPAKVWYWMWD